MASAAVAGGADGSARSSEGAAGATIVAGVPSSDHRRPRRHPTVEGEEGVEWEGRWEGRWEEKRASNSIRRLPLRPPPLRRISRSTTAHRPGCRLTTLFRSRHPGRRGGSSSRNSSSCSSSGGGRRRRRNNNNNREDNSISSSVRRRETIITRPMPITIPVTATTTTTPRTVTGTPTTTPPTPTPPIPTPTRASSSSSTSRRYAN